MVADLRTIAKNERRNGSSVVADFRTIVKMGIKIGSIAVALFRTTCKKEGNRGFRGLPLTRGILSDKMRILRCTGASTGHQRVWKTQGRGCFATTKFHMGRQKSLPDRQSEG